MHMTTSKAKYLFWIIALVVIMACVPTLSTPEAVPTMDANAVGTYIVETAQAAATNTALALPTLTPTITLTPTPRFTDTPVPTATSTIIFILASPTPLAPPTTASSNNAYACQVVSVTPANGTSFPTRTDFDASWAVRNIGKKNWDRGTVDYAYISGDKIHKVSLYDLSQTIKVGDSTNLVVAMSAPKDPGTYVTNWALQAGSNNFCTMTLGIVVK